MSNLSLANPLLVSVRVYRALLVAYPNKFREQYETQMVQVFRDSCRDAYGNNGMSGVIDLWLHTFADLLVTALIERMMEGSQYMFSPKVILWGSVAGVFSGIFWIMMGLAPSSAGPSMVLALVLGLGGLVGLYSRQAGQGGRLGLAGFILGILGTVLALATLWWGFTSGRFTSASMVTDPALLAPPVLSLCLGLVVVGIGIMLLGVTSLRGKTRHPSPGLPLGVGFLGVMQGITFWMAYYIPLSQGRDPWDSWPPQGYVLNVTVLVLFGLGWLVLGTRLATEAESRIAQPPPASV